MTLPISQADAAHFFDALAAAHPGPYQAFTELLRPLEAMNPDYGALVYAAALTLAAYCNDKPFVFTSTTDTSGALSGDPSLN